MKARALLFVLASVPGVARADPIDAGVSMLARLAPRAGERHEASTLLRARQLARLLEGVPDVVRAEVHLSLPDASRAPLDAPLPPARATIVLQVREAAPPDDEIARIARGVVPDLTEATLTVSHHAVPKVTPPARARVGPFEVALASERALRVTLGLSLACNALLAGLLLWRTRRKRPRDAKVDPRGRGRPAP